jgi:2',3'-cyclic-nucleotide 2'-phosphodiesterase (5'-nucleotidase family)
MLLAVILSLALALAACGDGAGTMSEAADGDTPESTPDVSQDTLDCDPDAAGPHLVFVHVNDLHARYAPHGATGSPHALIRGYVNAVRAEVPCTFFTNAGDDHEKGSVTDALSQGRVVNELVRALEYDVRTLGNHDFAWSLENALDLTRDEHAAVVASNLAPLSGVAAGWGAVPYAERRCGCARVGFMGLVGPAWDETDQQPGGSYYPELAYDGDLESRLAGLVAQHRAEVDLLVLVSHLGMDTDIRLADGVAGLDLILGGHSHTTVHQPFQGEHALVVQSGAYAEHVARLDLDPAPGGGLAGWTYRLEDVDTALASPSPALQEHLDALLAPTLQAAEGTLVQVLAAPGDLGAARWVADGSVAWLPGVDAALFPAGDVAHAIAAGPLSLQGLFDAYASARQPPGTPDMTSLFVGEVSGPDLQLLAALDSQGWAYAGPQQPQAGGTWRVAMPKRDALHPDRLGLGNLVVESPAYAADPWEVVATMARHRAQACLYLDSDQPVPDCQRRP